MWPIQFAFCLRISCRIFLCSLTLSNTSSFLTRSDQRSFWRNLLTISYASCWFLFTQLLLLLLSEEKYFSWHNVLNFILWSIKDNIRAWQKKNVLTTSVSSVSIKVNEKLQQKSGNYEKFMSERQLNPLNTELIPICHLLILLGNLTFICPCIVSIFQYMCISNKMQRYTVYLYLETALHVSGGTSTRNM
jgi:hypothetical protein